MTMRTSLAHFEGFSLTLKEQLAKYCKYPIPIFLLSENRRLPKAKLRVSVVVDYMYTDKLFFKTMYSNNIAKTKKFAKLFLPVHTRPR